MVSQIIHHNNRQKIHPVVCIGKFTFIPYSQLIQVKIQSKTVNIVRMEIILFVLIVVKVSTTSNRDSVFSRDMDTRDNILSVLYKRSSKYTSKSH